MKFAISEPHQKTSARLFLLQSSLAGEDAGQRGKLWYKIIFLFQYLSFQKKEIVILAAAHMLTSKLQGSLYLNAYHGHLVSL